MDPERPRIPIGFDLLSFAGQILFSVLYIALKDCGLEVGGELDTVGWVNIDHLHLASKVFSVCKGAHHGEAIAEDEAVRPIYVVLVKIDGFAVILLWIGEEFTLDVLAFCNLQNGFGTHAFVDMQCNGIDGERLCLLFACPFQPWIVVSECIGEGFGFFSS